MNVEAGSELLSYYFNTVNTSIEKIKQVQIDSKWDNKNWKMNYNSYDNEPVLIHQLSAKEQSIMLLYPG